MVGKYIQEVLDSGVFTSSNIDGGKYVQKLERAIRDFTGADYCVAVSSGTSALYSSIITMKIKGQIAFPSFTFKATQNSILATNCLPLPIDVRLDNMTISTLIEPMDCIMPVHLYGHVAYMEELLDYDVPIIEDCCQAMGSRLNNRHVGRFGTVGCFSFYPSKIINGGEGGCIITDNKEIADRLKLLRNHGDKNSWGLNLRLSELHAALAFEQMENIDKLLLHRKMFAKILDERIQDVTKYYPRKGEERNNQLFTVTVKNNDERTKLHEQYPNSRIYYPYTLGWGINAEKLSKTVLSFNTQ